MFAGFAGLTALGDLKRHGPRLAELGDPLRGHLQRVDHRDADPARPPGREVPAVRAAAILRRNLLIYGIGGLIAPFIGIKLIDIVITPWGSTDATTTASRIRIVLVFTVLLGFAYR